MPVSPVMVRALRDRLITGENLDGTIATVERLEGEADRHGSA